MNFTYETDHLILRAEQENCCDRVLDFYLRNRQWFDVYEMTRPEHFYTLAYQKANLRAESVLTLKGRALRFYAYEKTQYAAAPLEAPVAGTVCFSDIRISRFASADFGYKLDHSLWGRGLAREMCACMTENVAADLGIHRITAFIMPVNKRSIALIESLGFTLEGTARSYCEINHRREDHLQYSLIL